MTDCPIPCNLCGSVDVEVIGTRDRDAHPLRTTICRMCGLVWSNPRPGPEEVRRYYSREYRLDYKGHSTPSRRHIARSGRGALNRYRALAPYLKRGARILDAGAGGGEVVYVLRKLGFDASGLEPDEQYARHARETLDVPVATGFVQDATFPPGHFDVVTMYHALEHVEDPAAIMSRLRNWMSDAGVLLIEVPNIEAACISPAHRFHFAHFYNFSRAALEALGRKTGFEPVQTTTSPDGGNLISVFRSAKVPQPAQADAGNYARVASIVTGHTALKYYCSRWPYAGPVNRLRTYLADTRAAQGCETPTQVLDKLIAAQLKLRKERQTFVSSIPVEYAAQRKIRTRNKLYYRFNHWPIWIFVFFIAPGPLTFDLFERGFDSRMFMWLAVVLLLTGIAGVRGELPGVEPAPYIIRFTEDRPNPLYRRVCYTFAWSAAITFAMLNIAGLVVAIVTGQWYLKQIYRYAYFPIAGSIWLLGALGKLPRVMPSTKGEGHERRYFYGTVWAMCLAQPALWLMWYVLPNTRAGNSLKLGIFLGILAFVGNLARMGRLPRTRPIVPGELAVSD